MAKQSAARDGIYVERPRADAYMTITILTTVALLVACLLMYLEYSA